MSKYSIATRPSMELIANPARSSWTTQSQSLDHATTSHPRVYVPCPSTNVRMHRVWNLSGDLRTCSGPLPMERTSNLRRRAQQRVQRQPCTNDDTATRGYARTLKHGVPPCPPRAGWLCHSMPWCTHAQAPRTWPPGRPHTACGTQ